MLSHYGIFIQEDLRRFKAEVVMNYDISQVENFFEESNALFEGYVERVFESESINDLFSASHWYADAMFCILTTPRQH